MKTNSDRYLRLSIGAAWLLALAALAVDAIHSVPLLTAQQDLGRLMGTLFIAAFAVERAVEILIRAAREPQARRWEYRIWVAERALKLARITARQAAMAAQQAGTPLPAAPAPGTTTPAQWLVKHDVASRRLFRHGHKTRALALAMSIPLGLTVALLGIRILGAVADPATASRYLSGLFAPLDVGLSGLLIAGGSDGIHRLVAGIKEAVGAGS